MLALETVYKLLLYPMHLTDTVQRIKGQAVTWWMGKLVYVLESNAARINAAKQATPRAIRNLLRTPVHGRNQRKVAVARYKSRGLQTPKSVTSTASANETPNPRDMMDDGSCSVSDDEMSVGSHVVTMRAFEKRKPPPAVQAQPKIAASVDAATFDVEETGEDAPAYYDRDPKQNRVARILLDEQGFQFDSVYDRKRLSTKFFFHTSKWALPWVVGYHKANRNNLSVYAFSRRRREPPERRPGVLLHAESGEQHHLPARPVSVGSALHALFDCASLRT